VRTYEQLAPDEQQRAVSLCADSLLATIVEGLVRFNAALNEDDLQARIDQALADSDRNQTPWFAGEYVMDAAGVEIRGMAQCEAEDALYAGPGERVISLPEVTR